MHCLSFDLEEWFHFLDLEENLDVEMWDSYESHVERMTYSLLDFLDNHNQQATFFVLGWIAVSYPALVREVALRGHEIGCHSYSHPLLYNINPTSFEVDLVKALDSIEHASDVRPVTYRAPGFSITPKSLWAFDVLRKHKITTDSSVFPALRAHGGLPGAPTLPFVIETKFGNMYELPLSSTSLLGLRYVFSGGGYFRITPGWLLERFFRKADQRNMPVITYFHPRDFFTDVPIPDISIYRRFKARIGLAKTFKKLSKLLKTEKFCPVGKYVEHLAKSRMPQYTPQALLNVSRNGVLMILVIQLLG